MDRKTPDVSIVVTAYNRAELLRQTLENLLAALRGLDGEIVVVDDGSEPPVEEQLGGLPQGPVRLVRRANGGSAAARHTGIMEARGEYLLVSDSDDFVAEEKLVRHLAAMRESGADLSYCDEGYAFLRDGEKPRLEPSAERLRPAKSVADLLIRIQPMPHNIVYRTEWIRGRLREPAIPPLKEFGPSGDTWIYYNLCTAPGRIAKIDAALTFQSKHDGERYQAHWERLGVSALLLVEAFAASCPANEATSEAREYAGTGAFQSWRRLPRGFSREYEERLLAVWRAMPQGPLEDLGGANFRRLARVLGPVGAGKLMRLRRPAYAATKTLTAEQRDSLIRSLPAKPRFA